MKDRVRHYWTFKEKTAMAASSLGQMSERQSGDEQKKSCSVNER
ncbi:hypothetical protein HSIEG1_3660 [Enterococcus sp. HSIEG1]|nr:hypothetical protein HSIEG1_3660 [Enterococcus sp. HSIEG1]